MNSVSQRVDERTSHTRYNGKVRLDFDPVKHRYKINGEYANGVTTALGIIAKPQLIYWSANMAADHVKSTLVPGKGLDEIQIQQLVEECRKAHLRKRDSAADQGTYIHNWIEDFVNRKSPAMPVNENLQRTINDFLAWWDNTNIEVIYPERAMCSVKYMLAGTPDLICKVDGKLTIMDWKTGKGIYPEMFMQMAAYAIMYEEEFPGEKVECLQVVNASVTNMFQTEVRCEVETFKKAYLSALELYKVNKEVEKLFK